MAEGESISRAFFAFIMIGTLVAGTLNNITVKQQDLTTIDGHEFYHPFVQTLIMFIAEFACLIAFQIGMRFNREFRETHDREEKEAENKGIRTKNTWWIPAIPAVCDITGTCMQMISISFIDQSIYVMLRGGVPVVTAGLSILFLKKVLSKAQYLGLGLAVLGITIVGIYGYLTSSEKNSNLVIGLVFVLASLFTTGIQFVIEEKILAVNHIHPLRMVGLEGIFGIIYTSVAIAVANNISCNFDPKNSGGCNVNGAIEDFPGAMKAIFTMPLLFMWVFIGMLSLGFFNFFGMSVTKHVSSLARSILLISTTVIIWVYNLIFVTGSKFHWQQLVGFSVLVTGNLIYQRIIKIPALENATPQETPLVRGSKAKSSMGKVSISDPVTHDLLVREQYDD